MDNWLATTSYGWMVYKERIALRREPIVLGRPLAKRVRLALGRLSRRLGLENHPVHHPSHKLSEIVSG
jgi:hypothetical protein